MSDSICFGEAWRQYEALKRATKALKRLKRLQAATVLMSKSRSDKSLADLRDQIADTACKNSLEIWISIFSKDKPMLNRLRKITR